MARLHGKFSEIRIPPQSTGPRIGNVLYQNVELVSISGGTIVPGMLVSGQTSSVTGDIVDFNTVTTDDIVVLFNNNSPGQSFINGETLDIDGGSITAVVNELTDMYVNMTQIVDAENPHQGQRVDSEGSAHIRYGEGEQQLDAFGITRISQRNLLEAFKFPYSKNAKGIEEVIVGAATSTHLPDEGSVALTTTTGATDSIIFAGEHWYPYIPGVGREGVMTLTCGDSGKANNVRRWGLYDEDNGVFFELDGTTLYAVVRSNVTGTPVDTRVAQSSWSEDVLDGTGGVNNRTRVNLDIATFNIYWIDYAWLGTGRVRFGIYAPGGERIPCHVAEHANQNTSVYMSTGSLPMRWQNTNSGVTSGSSTLKIACGVVLDNHQPGDVTDYPYTNAYARTGVSVNAETLLLNIRTATTFASLPNRIVTRAVQGSTASTAEPVLVRIWKNATIGGTPSWAKPDSGSPLEIDTAGTFSGGTLVTAYMVGVDETDTADLSLLRLHTNLDSSASGTYSVTAESLGGAATDVAITFTWFDQG